jgi:phage terminase large subunit
MEQRQEFVVTTSIKKMLQLKKRKRVIQGGSSSGKTFGILPILVDEAIKVPNREISVVSESIPHLRRGAYKDFIRIMILTGRYNPSQLNKTLLKYTFTNGSYIEFFSADDESKLRGARRNVLYLNEANNVSFDAYQQLAIRTSGNIWIDYNPSAPFWAHNELIGNSDTDFIITTYKDNEALPQSIVDELEAAREKAKTSEYWSNYWNVYGLGQLGNLQGACIPEWNQLDKLPKEARVLCYGLDFGYTNDETACVGLYKWNDGYILHELFYKKKMLNKQISEMLNKKNVSDMIWADSAEPKSIAELKSYGHLIEPVKKGRDSIVYGINLINQNKIFVTKQSTNLIKELRSYIWLTDKEGNTLNKPIDKWNHIIDASRYAVMMQLDNPHKGSYNIW